MKTMAVDPVLVNCIRDLKLFAVKVDVKVVRLAVKRTNKARRVSLFILYY